MILLTCYLDYIIYINCLCYTEALKYSCICMFLGFEADETKKISAFADMNDIDFFIIKDTLKAVDVLKNYEVICFLICKSI